LKANEKGYISTLVEAGAFLTSPTCDFCFGKAASLVPGDRAISTQTLNVPGRLGSMDAEIYLASSAAVAAAAVEGAIADPTLYL
jgi:3-isopropylmalate/(R)-2-methylmalate dehydratase large subunit